MDLLSSELSIGNKVLKNRFIMAPIKTAYGVKTGEITERHLQFFGRRNKYVAAITPEPFYLHPSLRELPVQIGIHNDDMIPGLKRLSEIIHEHGARAIAHLNHPGRMVNPNIPGNQFFSSSKQPCPAGGKEPEAMDQSQIEESQELFEKAAIRAEQAGYDFVELQFGHGYLIAQFLSNYINKRTDNYGGTWENRTRYGIEVLEKVKNAINIPVIVRFSADEMIPKGLKLEDMMKLAALLEQNGASALHISSGSACESPPWYFQHMAIPKGKTWDFASAIKKKAGIPIITVGQINEKEEPERILQNGMADAVAIGRALIADPDFAGKILGDITDPIRPCASCLEGCLGGVKGGKGLMCVVNPEVGKEETEPPKVDKPKNIAVVGGGLAGIEAAMVLQKRGHNVTLYEKDKLGGLFNLSYLTPRKQNLKKINDYFINEAKGRLNIVYKEAGPNELIGKYDTVIAATGSHPKTPEIQGLKEWNWAEILKQENMPKDKKGIILGGGFIGAEIAEALAKNGNDITIIKKSKDIAPDMEPMSRVFLLKALQDLNIKILTDSDIAKINGDKVYLATPSNEVLIDDVDFIVYTKGMVPENSLKDQIEGNMEFFLIGDSKEIGKAMDAIHSAYDCAMTI